MRKRGKKFDMIWVQEGAQKHHVEVRFDKQQGDFLAELGGFDFSSKSFKELEQQLQERAKQLVGYEYKWYIEVSFDAEVGKGRSSWGIDWEHFDEDDVIVGIDFSFKVIERSQAVKTDEKDYRGTPFWRHMERDVEEVDGQLVGVGEATAQKCAIDEKGDADHTDVMEFTTERYAKLLAIRQGLRQLALRLHELVGNEDVKKVAKLLDGMKAPPLALAAESTIEQEKPKRRKRS